MQYVISDIHGMYDRYAAILEAIDFGDARVTVGERFTQTVDILPFIKIAFQTAQKYGYLEGCSFENMYISGCNYGWEIPGTFDCMATSHTFNMTYTLAEDVQ